jgi:hypothetical protein
LYDIKLSFFRSASSSLSLTRVMWFTMTAEGSSNLFAFHKLFTGAPSVNSRKHLAPFATSRARTKHFFLLTCPYMCTRYVRNGRAHKIHPRNRHLFRGGLECLTNCRTICLPRPEWWTVKCFGSWRRSILKPSHNPKITVENFTRCGSIKVVSHCCCCVVHWNFITSMINPKHHDMFMSCHHEPAAAAAAEETL